MATDSKKKDAMKETLGTVSAALTILEKYPEMEDDNFKLSLTMNPFAFILQLLYQTVGYDKVLNFITRTIADDIVLGPIETAVKGYILTQLKYIFDCTINPFISYDLLKNGVVFDLRTVDLINMLNYNPLDKSVNNKKRNGKWYYFGCEDFDYPDQLERAEDFNALLWYMKNRTVGSRSVWYGHKEQPNSGKHKSLYQKQKRKDGIITLEYSGRPTGLKDAEGNGMTLQTPFNNCIHVFIGNTKPVESGNLEATNNDIINVKEKQGKFTDVKNQAEKFKERLEKLLDGLDTKGLDKKSAKALKEEYKTEIGYAETIIDAIDDNEAISSKASKLEQSGVITKNEAENTFSLRFDKLGESLIIDRETYYTTNSALVDRKKRLYNDVVTQHTGDIYRPIEYNYYYHKTLLQFNIDYIFSLKLFESKSMAARLLDALSGCLTIGLDLSYQERMVQNEVRQMVHDMIENDDVVVSDCFFTFDNDTYNDMMQRSEYQRLGVFVAPNGAVGQPIDPDAIMQSLNDLSPNATHEQIQSAIESALFEVTRQVYPEYDDSVDAEWNADWRINIIDNLMQTLAYIIVLTVLSPKLYLLIAINLKIMGRESNFDLATFIDSFKQLISGIVKTIRDELMRLFKEWLMEIIGDLAKNLGAKLALEQIMYYQQLLRKCIECFRLHGTNTIGYDMATVDYADIYETENNTEPVNSEC